MSLIKMYSLETLHNKIKLLLVPQQGTDSVTVLVLVKVGSRYEPAPLNGISHFIEHLMFKGTAKRPTSLDITKELDGVGAEYNAFTTKDHTGYYVKVSADKATLALEIVADMLYHSLFAKEEIEKERGVIIEEINMYEDNPLLLVESVFEEAVFKGHPLGRLISGSKENIRKISGREITNFFKHNYLSQNTLVAVGGKFNKGEIKRLVNKYFNQRFKKVVSSNYAKFKSRQNQPQIKIKTKETQQVHLALGYPAYKITDPKIYPLTLLSIILGGNMSSRLFMEIREKMGLAYYIKSTINPYQDTGALVIQAGLDKEKIDLAIKTIIKELHQLTTAAVTKEELKRSKEYLKGRLILSLEDSTVRTQWLATQLLLKNKIETLTAQLKKIDRVKVADLQKVAKEIFTSKKLNLGIIGPYKNAEKFYKLI